MAVGSTNVNLAGTGSIYDELNGGASGGQVKFSDMVEKQWSNGPAPGDGTYSYFGWGLKTGNANPLYDPMDNASGQISSNFKFDYFKGATGFFDQSVFTLDLYIENQIPPAPRTDPPNHVDVDLALYDDTLTSNSICPIGGFATQGGGTYGPTDVSQSFTFNVEYFYVNGGVNCQGLNPYNIDIHVNGSSVLFIGGAGPGSQPVDYNAFSSVPTNTGSGFEIDCYFTP